ncbi:MAG: type II toxin-antitoxin system VapC family toxin [Candidatus Helarchaeota archaeon]
MKNIYLDTSIIISFLKSDDTFHLTAKKIINAKTFKRIGSPITVLEITSVISRQFNNLKFDSTNIKEWNKLNEQEKKSLIILYYLEKLPIDFYACLGNEKIQLKRRDFRIQIDFSRAYRIAPLFPLRTLDNLQIASALNIRDVRNIRIDYFITTDKVILDVSKEIQKAINLTIIDPETFVDIEHL